MKKLSFVFILLLVLLLVHLSFIRTFGQTITFERSYGGILNEAAYSVKQTIDGGYILTGWTQNNGDLDGDLFLLKTDAEGNELWTWL